MSPSSRRAWIEIYSIRVFWTLQRVALLAEGVDRNHPQAPAARHTMVALLAEGVDRNMQASGEGSVNWVALLAEGVDRNSCEETRSTLMSRSPSSRRAWIEILIRARPRKV